MEQKKTLTIYSRKYPVCLEFRLNRPDQWGLATISVSVRKTKREDTEGKPWQEFLYVDEHIYVGGKLRGGKLVLTSALGFERAARRWHRAEMREGYAEHRYGCYF